jgi:hypothetical protein
MMTGYIAVKATEEELIAIRKSGCNAARELELG